MRVIRYPLASMADGTEQAVHIHELSSISNDGPTIGICGSIHGDETVSSQIVMEVARQLEGNLRSGRVLLLPVANPFGFAERRRETPLDSQNLNRVFPGDRDGWLSEKLAAVITAEFLNKIDVLIDLHAGGGSQTVDYVYILNDEPLSRSFGSKILYKRRDGLSGTYFQGTSSGVAKDRDIRAVTIRAGRRSRRSAAVCQAWCGRCSEHASTPAGRGRLRDAAAGTGRGRTDRHAPTESRRLAHDRGAGAGR